MFSLKENAAESQLGLPSPCLTLHYTGSPPQTEEAGESRHTQPRPPAARQGDACPRFSEPSDSISEKPASCLYSSCHMAALEAGRTVGSTARGPEPEDHSGLDPLPLTPKSRGSPGGCGAQPAQPPSNQQPFR